MLWKTTLVIAAFFRFSSGVAEVVPYIEASRKYEYAVRYQVDEVLNRRIREDSRLTQAAKSELLRNLGTYSQVVSELCGHLRTRYALAFLERPNQASHLEVSSLQKCSQRDFHAFQASSIRHFTWGQRALIRIATALGKSPDRVLLALASDLAKVNLSTRALIEGTAAGRLPDSAFLTVSELMSIASPRVGSHSGILAKYLKFKLQSAFSSFIPDFEVDYADFFGSLGLSRFLRSGQSDLIVEGLDSSEHQVGSNDVIFLFSNHDATALDAVLATHMADKLGVDEVLFLTTETVSKQFGKDVLKNANIFVREDQEWMQKMQERINFLQNKKVAVLIMPEGAISSPRLLDRPPLAVMGIPFVLAQKISYFLQRSDRKAYLLAYFANTFEHFTSLDSVPLTVTAMGLVPVPSADRNWAKQQRSAVERFFVLGRQSHKTADLGTPRFTSETRAPVHVESVCDGQLVGN